MMRVVEMSQHLYLGTCYHESKVNNSQEQTITISQELLTKLLQGAKKSGIAGKDLAKVDEVSKPPKGSTAMPRKRTITTRRQEEANKSGISTRSTRSNK
jgi:hypothetical protein